MLGKVYWALKPEPAILPPLLFAFLQSKVVADVTKHAATIVLVILPLGAVTVPESVLPPAGGGLGGVVGGVVPPQAESASAMPIPKM
jgi:hypothetical protein